MNPMQEAIKKISEQTIAQYKFPVWGIIQDAFYFGGGNGAIADVLIKEPNKSNNYILKGVPILVGGKNTIDGSLKYGDIVKVSFDSGEFGQPAIIAVSPVGRSDETAMLSKFFGRF